jgi:ADP-ribose pyrophosphatase YjhB (NUDIX family)
MPRVVEARPLRSLIVVDVGVFAAIQDERGWLLLIRRRDVDLWEMPGGRVERGESPGEAIRREVAEETGLDVEVHRLVGIYRRPSGDLLVLQFECRGGGEPEQSPEVRDVDFFPMDALPEPINPAVAERIDDVRSATMMVHVRTQHAPSGREWAEAWQRAHAGRSATSGREEPRPDHTVDRLW